jgi:hypothetical protein
VASPRLGWSYGGGAAGLPAGVVDADGNVNSNGYAIDFAD